MDKDNSVCISREALLWLESVLQTRFGHRVMLTIIDEKSVRVTIKGASGDIVFDTPQSAFYKYQSSIPCCKWDAVAEGWQPALGKPLPAPAVSCLPVPLIEQREGRHFVHYDILGLSYWMLARLEEIGRSDLDIHGRFPATSSHAFMHGYLERPIVDEWLDILSQVIQRQWPGIAFKRHEYSMQVSHDVDRPSRYGFQSLKGLIRVMGGDLLKHQDFRGAALAPWVRLNTRTQLHPWDPYNTFDMIMDISDQHGLTSVFNFVCGHTGPTNDTSYESDNPAIRYLMRKIHTRGHEIGLHPSYDSYRNPQALMAEARRLMTICAQEGIRQDNWGARMHYLRWEHGTLQTLEQAGMSYDSSLGYVTRPGFRSGTCFEYPGWDAIKRQRLKIHVRPLVAMECSIIDEKNMALGTGQPALDIFKRLKDNCRAVNGTFSLLWHNSELRDCQHRTLYTEVLAA